MRREDLRAMNPYPYTNGRERPVSDAELAELGYVKLTGIDMEELRGELVYVLREGLWSARAMNACGTILAALDLEESGNSS